MLAPGPHGRPGPLGPLVPLVPWSPWSSGPLGPLGPWSPRRREGRKEGIQVGGQHFVCTREKLLICTRE